MLVRISAPRHCQLTAAVPVPGANRWHAARAALDEYTASLLGRRHGLSLTGSEGSPTRRHARAPGRPGTYAPLPRNLCRRPFGKTPYLKKYTTKVAIQHNGRSFAHPSSPTAMDVLHEQGFRRADRWFVINLPLFRHRARRERFHESPTGAANIGKVHAFVRRVQRLCTVVARRHGMMG